MVTVTITVHENPDGTITQNVADSVDAQTTVKELQALADQCRVVMATAEQARDQKIGMTAIGLYRAYLAERDQPKPDAPVDSPADPSTVEPVEPSGLG